MNQSVIDHIGFPVSSNSLRAVSGIVTAAAAPVKGILI
jgi:hypothetical protein